MNEKVELYDRVCLTESQEKLANRFDELCEEMKRAGIGFVYNYGYVLLMNMEHVKEFVSVHDMDPESEIYIDEELIEFDDMRKTHVDFSCIGYVYEDEEVVGVRYK